MDQQLYSRAQQLILQILPFFTTPLSAAGSMLIIYSILTHRKREMSTYHRLMLGMSIEDFLSSTGMVVMGHWAVPKGTEFVAGARGSELTCQVAFFFINFLFGSIFYSISLAIYFVLVVRFNWPKLRITRYIEPIFHFIATVPTFVSGIVVAVDGGATPMYTLPGFCYATAGPAGASEATSPLIYVASFSLILLICMALLIQYARNTDHYVDQYRVGQDSRPQAANTVAKEALLYIVSFFLVYCPVVGITYFEQTEDVTDINRALCFAVALSVKLLTPLQGFFNAIIFFRGRLLPFLQQDEGRISLDLFVAYLNASGNVCDDQSERAESTA